MRNRHPHSILWVALLVLAAVIFPEASTEEIIVQGQLELFLQPEVINVFNENGVIDGNLNVLDATNSGLEPFNPFTETPVRGVHWDLDPDFGQPINTADYQLPREFCFSVGLRF